MDHIVDSCSLTKFEGGLVQFYVKLKTLMSTGRIVWQFQHSQINWCVLQVAEAAGEHNGREPQQDADICGDKEEGR